MTHTTKSCARGRLILVMSAGALCAASGSARAGGFYVPEIGPQAAGMGAAMTAHVGDASAIFHNPAGLASGSGTQVLLSMDLFMPQVRFYRRPIVDPNSPDGAELRFDKVENTNGLLAAPFLGASTDLRDDLAAGVAVYVPFGASIDYPGDGAQRHVVTGVSLEAIHVSTGVGYRLSERVRVGASVNYIFSQLALQQRNAIQYVNGDPEVFPDPDASLEGETSLKGTDPFSLSASLGITYGDPAGRYAIGASVMTPVTLRFEGRADIRNDAITPLMDEDGNVLQEGGQRRDDFRTEIPLPLIARLGAAVRPHPRVLVAADVNWQRWSTSDEIVIDFQAEHELLPTPGVYLYDVTIENQWRDTFSARLGAEGAPLATRPLQVRGGVFFDQSPIADEHFDLLTPDSDKLGIGVGAGYGFALGDGRTLQVDLAYQHLFFAERNVTASEKTILNKPSPSFYTGVTRADFDIVLLSAGMRL